MVQRNMELTPASGSFMRATRQYWFVFSFFLLIAGTTYVWWGLRAEGDMRFTIIVGSAIVLFGVFLLGRTLMLARIPAASADGESET
jgi:hypothetical protein